ncbi:dienelactone hydrolase endo-1-3,1,4-beta-D-glucanase [Flagelloscypha sp. PMI_526]|nr:dienelactone hydrolase endo-1-3,1,4-beta-D-glucanase [Flagelloscypha sp. PMI_526]
MSCPDCVKGELLVGEPRGIIQNDASYFSCAPKPTVNETKTKAIVLLTDIFGLQIPNPKLIADHLANQLNMDVYVPDMFDGRYMLKFGALKMPDRAGIKTTWLDWCKMFLVIIPAIPSIIANRPSVMDNRVKAFIQKIKAEKGYTKIGGVGYCLGGSAVIRLSQPGIMDAVVCAHPGGSFDASQVCSPITFICAQDDSSFPEKNRLKFEANLAARKGKGEMGHEVDYEFEVYEGTAHGFAMRPVLAYPDVAKAFEGSKKQTIQWFSKML